jgi:hypothetical protein
MQHGCLSAGMGEQYGWLASWMAGWFPMVGFILLYAIYSEPSYVQNCTYKQHFKGMTTSNSTYFLKEYYSK